MANDLSDVESMINDLMTMNPSQQAASAATQPQAVTSNFDALDALMGDLESGRTSLKPGVLQHVPQGVAQSPVVRVGVAAGPAAGVRPGVSAGPGARAGVSAGPGAGVSAGPGARAGISAGPGAGRGISAGPGAAGLARGIAAGPGPAGKVPAAKGGIVSAGPGAAWLENQKKKDAGIKMAEQMPDGRKLQYTGPPCCVCNEMIIGKVTNALGKTWHPEHFNCKGCEKPFPDGAFIEHEDAAWCENCYWAKFAPKCCKCAMPIMAKCINACNKSYHSEHFLCNGCGCDLAGKAYKEFEDEPYCNMCYKDRQIFITPAALICSMCKKPIFGEYLDVFGQKMHPEHFKCEACGKDLHNGDSQEYDGKLYCLEDWRKLVKNVCFGCRKPITGRSLTALGRVWHPEHFVCAHCHEPFTGSNFYEHGGKPYCDLHFAQFFANVCAKCEKPIIGDSFFAMGKYWHHEHFTCTYCNEPLQEKTLMEWEGKGMCRKCYSNLPKHVRDTIEKQKRNASLARERREKEEEKTKKEEAKKASAEAKAKAKAEAVKK